METVFIHPFAGVLSAYGMGLADQTVMREQAVELPLDAAAMPELERLADAARRRAAEAALAAQGAEPAQHRDVARGCICATPAPRRR